MVKLGLIALVVATSLAIISSIVTSSNVYSVSAPFSTAPTEDNELRDWLADQPGVVPHNILIHRRDSNRIELSFVITQNLWKHPAFPDLESQCSELGYELNHKFTDTQQ